MEKKNNPYLPIGVGFIGVSFPLFIAIFYAPTRTGKISILITGAVILILGLLIVIPKRS